MWSFLFVLLIEIVRDGRETRDPVTLLLGSQDLHHGGRGMSVDVSDDDTDSNLFPPVLS